MTGPKKAMLKQTNLFVTMYPLPMKVKGVLMGIIKSLKELPQGQMEIVLLEFAICLYVWLFSPVFATVFRPWESLSHGFSGLPMDTD